MTTTLLPEDSAAVAKRRFHWSAVFAGAAVAAATTFFLVTLGAGFGLMLTPASGAATFITLGAIYVLAAQAFGFAAGGHVAGRLIGPAVETTREEEFRAGLHGLVMWAVAATASLALAGVIAASGISGSTGAARSADGVSEYWADILLRPTVDHAMAPGADLAQDKAEAARVLAADLVPGALARDANHANLVRLVVLDAGMTRVEAIARVNDVKNRMRREMDTARKAAAYASLWTAFALLFGAVVAVAATISARWEDDKIHFSMKRRY